MSEPTDRPTSGFEIFERLIAEAGRAGGTSPTQERWTREALEKLSGARSQRLSPQETRALSRIERAFEEARALLGRCLRAPSPPGGAGGP